MFMRYPVDRIVLDASTADLDLTVRPSRVQQLPIPRH